jgi:hypothetical protein
MKMTYVPAALLLFALVTPSLAATEYYVVQDTATKKCTIVEQRPTTTTSIVVGDGKVFTSRTEAEAGMKTVKVCSSN